MRVFCPEMVKGIKIACSGGRRERRDKGLGSAEFTGTKQQVNLRTKIMAIHCLESR